MLLLVVFGLSYSLSLFLCCFDHRSWKCFCINYADYFRKVFIENPYSFGKKGAKALKGSCQNASNAAVDQGSQSEYPLACLFLKLLKKTPLNSSELDFLIWSIILLLKNTKFNPWFNSGYCLEID